MPTQKTIAQTVTNGSEEIATLRARIAELEAENASLLLKAYSDHLTGLPNRTRFYDSLSQALTLAKRNKKEAVVMFFGIDNFRGINDALGIDSGNALILDIAARLKYTLRRTDTLARYGRDEFMILLPEVSQGMDAVIVAEKILQAMQTPFKIADKEIFVTVNLGISLYPTDGDSERVIIQNAATALTAARKKPVSSYEFYSSVLRENVSRRTIMENNIRSAIKKKEFSLFYQPQIDIKTNTLVGMEALLRWRSRDRGYVLPGEFIPIMEETGLIEQLGDWILETACEQNKAWQSAGLPPVRVAINLSPRQLSNRGLPAAIERVLKRNMLDPQWLELEMTEHAIINNDQALISLLRDIRDMGVQISLDDFGTGYSALNYLNYLPLTRLKIDKSLVCNARLGHDATIPKAIITMAHSLGLKVIAEGVESEEQLEVLRDLNCDEVQGYLFYKPLHSDEIPGCFS